MASGINQTLRDLTQALNSFGSGKTIDRLSQGGIPPRLEATSSHVKPGFGLPDGTPLPPGVSGPDAEKQLKGGTISRGITGVIEAFSTASKAVAEFPGVKQMAGGITSHAPLAGISNVASGAGSAMIATGNPAAMAVGGLMKFGGALTEGVDKVRKWVDGVHNMNMQFAEFSGAMAHVQAESEMREMELSQRKGDQLAESAEELSRARSGMNKALAPLEVGWQKLQNKVGSWGGQLVEGIGRSVMGKMSRNDFEIAEHYAEMEGSLTEDERKRANETISQVTGGRTGEDLKREMERENGIYDDDASVNMGDVLLQVARTQRELENFGKPGRFQPGGGHDF